LSTTAPSGVLPSDWIARGQRFRLCGEPFDELVGDGFDDDDPLGRHAYLALVHEGAEGGGLHGFVEIGVFQHDERSLAAEFEQDGLHVFGGTFSDDAADAGGAGEVDTADGGMIDQRADNGGGVIRGVGDEADGAWREALLR
jgi:hypothetical protein